MLHMGFGFHDYANLAQFSERFSSSFQLIQSVICDLSFLSVKLEKILVVEGCLMRFGALINSYKPG